MTDAKLMLEWDDIEKLANANYWHRDAQGELLNAVRAKYAAQRATIEALENDLLDEKQLHQRTSQQHDTAVRQLTAMTKERDEWKAVVQEIADKPGVATAIHNRELKAQLTTAQSKVELLAGAERERASWRRTAEKLEEEKTAAQRSHAITQEGYTALRANYDTLSRQYQELTDTLKNYDQADYLKNKDLQTALTACRTELEQVRQLMCFETGLYRDRLTACRSALENLVAMCAPFSDPDTEHCRQWNEGIEQAQRAIAQATEAPR